MRFGLRTDWLRENTHNDGSPGEYGLAEDMSAASSEIAIIKCVLRSFNEQLWL